ncbi:MAG: ABC transporter ATP-binding protein [Actinobacteria bacterium]|nr:ABC transporter ATP-binding protein [Actinomycetota bacterium]
MLAVTDVSIRLGDRKVLDHISIELANGEIVALVGPSGVGKSTLLRVIAGLLVADIGSIMLDGCDITALPTYRRHIGLMFQDEQLFPHLSVAGNVAFGLRMQRRPRAEVNRRVGELLTLVGLEGFGARGIERLSGGEAKRVALARALAPEPAVLLLDEPLTGLDRELHDRLVDDLAGMLRAANTTTLLVTHDQDEAAALADRIITLGLAS